jgi:hypothetical protein
MDFGFMALIRYSALGIRLYANVRVKTVAAAFRYFHEYWKDKRAELQSNGAGAQ